MKKESVQREEKAVNIFDLSKLDDVDSSVVLQLPKRVILSNAIVSLFDMKDKLTISEIMVGLARHYHFKNLKKSNITAYLMRLLKLGKIVRVCHGVYAKNRSENEPRYLHAV